MSKRRVTFGKLQRERDKQAKQAAKRDRRAARLEESDSDEVPEAAPAGDQTAVLEALAALHEAYDAGRMGIDEFEEQRDELRSRLRVD
jgi:hypothetical protein